MNFVQDRPILVYVPDFVFRSRIVATAERVGVYVQPTGNRAGFAAALPQALALVIDLKAEGEGTLELVEQARQMRPDLPIVGFLPHVEVELRKRARTAGVSPVLPRSKFTETLPDLLRNLAADHHPS